MPKKIAAETPRSEENRSFNNTECENVRKTSKRLIRFANDLERIPIQDEQKAKSSLVAAQRTLVEDLARLGVSYFGRVYDNPKEWQSDESVAGLLACWLEKMKNRHPDQSPSKPSGGGVERRVVETNWFDSFNSSVEGIPDQVTMMHIKPTRNMTETIFYQTSAAQWIAETGMKEVDFWSHSEQKKRDSDTSSLENG